MVASRAPENAFADNQLSTPTVPKSHPNDEAYGHLGSKAAQEQEAARQVEEAYYQFGERYLGFQNVNSLQGATSQAEAEYQQALARLWTARAEFEKAIGME